MTEQHSFALAGADPRLAGGRLTINLHSLVANYHALQHMCAPASVAGVLKADAYGLGVEFVAPALIKAGCGHFFVALPEEGRRLRDLAPDAAIFVLAGLFEAEAAPFYSDSLLIPVLNTEREIAIWEAHCGIVGEALPCAIHVDTGMNRLGLSVEQATAFAEDNALTKAVKPILLISHFATADTPLHPLNRRQIETFQKIRQSFNGMEASIANSAGVFIGKGAHFDLTRPGIALYGGAPVTGLKNPMLPVATAEARIIQLRNVAPGETVSYGATVTVDRPTTLAVTAVGYADGYMRTLSGSGVPLRTAVPQGGMGFAAGRRVPVIGRITMDLTIFDVTDCGHDVLQPGDFVELFGENIPIDEAADAAGTIAYELLTSLGPRWHRHVIQASAE